VHGLFFGRSLTRHALLLSRRQTTERAKAVERQTAMMAAIKKWLNELNEKKKKNQVTKTSPCHSIIHIGQFANNILLLLLLL